MTDFNVWVFGLDLPDVTHKAWDAIKRTFAQGVEMTAANDAVFTVVFGNFGVCRLHDTSCYPVGAAPPLGRLVLDGGDTHRQTKDTILMCDKPI